MEKTRNDLVELIVPARAEFLQVVRLVVAGMGYATALDIEGIEDMKLAVAEACSQFFSICGDQGMQLMVRVQTAGHGLEVEVLPWGECTPPENAGIPPTHEEVIGQMLIETLADRVEPVSGRLGIKLRKEWLVVEGG